MEGFVEGGIYIWLETGMHHTIAFGTSASTVYFCGRPLPIHQNRLACVGSSRQEEYGFKFVGIQLHVDVYGYVAALFELTRTLYAAAGQNAGVWAVMWLLHLTIPT